MKKKLEIGPSPKPAMTPDGEPDSSWDTLDSHGQVTFKCRWGYDRIPVPDAHYDLVHASHVLEHLPWWKTSFALAEAKRILKKNGEIQIWVPDAIKIVKLAIEDPEELVRLEKGWAYGNMLNPTRDPWMYMNARVLWGARPGEIGQEQHFHRSMFGAASLKGLLLKSGFVDVERIERNPKHNPGHGWTEFGLRAYA